MDSPTEPTRKSRRTNQPTNQPTLEVPRSSAEERATRARTRVNSGEKYAVIKAIAGALSAHSFPPMDERLKNIVASQAGHLLAGGFALDDIKYAGIELGLSWDERRGHNRLTHLASRVRAEFWADETKRHDALKAEDRAAYPRYVYGKPHPNEHRFANDGAGNCRHCDAPIGTHVRRVEEVS